MAKGWKGKGEVFGGGGDQQEIKRGNETVKIPTAVIEGIVRSNEI